MIKNRVILSIAKMLFVLFLMVFCFSWIQFTARAYHKNDIDERDNIEFTYTFRPIIEKASYDIETVIPMKFSFKCDCKIDRLYSTTDGFAEIESPYIYNDNVMSSAMLITQKDEVKYSVVAILENGKSIESTIYGIIENNRVYLNANSYFGARDIYWADVLSSSANTKNEEKIKHDYEVYLQKVNLGAIKETKYIVENKDKNFTKSGEDTSVSGLIRWYDDWEQPHPLQFAKLEVMDEGGGLFGWFDKFLGITYTDEYGNYSFDFSNREGGSNIYIKIYPEGENSKVKTGADNDYVLRTQTDYGVATGSLVIRNQDIMNGYVISHAFQISQAINVSSRFVKEMSGTALPNVTIKYPHNESLNNCYYENNCIYILNEDDHDELFDGELLHPYSSWDVIQHEYFHHVQECFGITNNPRGWHMFNVNMYDHFVSHYTGNLLVNCMNEGGCANPSLNGAKEATINLVYAEAWPSILAEISQHYALDNWYLDSNIHTVGDIRFTSYNISRMHYNNPDENDGEGFEETVLGILWDLYDSDSEYFDKIYLGATAFWNLSINSGAKTLSELINYFSEVYPSFYYSSRIGDLLSHYGVGASNLNASTISSTPPTFSWTANGLSNNLQNDSFEVVFYNYNEIEILRINTTSTSVTLTQEQWNAILYSYGKKFYVMVLAYQTSYPITGGYYSNSIECIKPEVEDITSDVFISVYTRYQEKIFKLCPEQAINYHITFATAGNKVVQTFGNKDTLLYLYSSNGNLLTSNDNQGYFLNAFINYNFTAYEEYVIKVKFYSENEAGECKIGILPTNVISNSFEQIPNINVGNSTNPIGQMVQVNLNSVYMYTLTVSISGNYHITTSQDYGCNITDTYLYLVDPRLTTVCIYNDDGGNGNNAAFDAYLAANVPYLVIVSPYNITTTSGDIWLTIQAI